MFCEKCGKEVSDGAAFCEYCGNPSEKDSGILPQKLADTYQAQADQYAAVYSCGEASYSFVINQGTLQFLEKTSASETTVYFVECPMEIEKAEEE